MEAIDTEKTVGRIAAENSAAARVFETLGVDYCCGGRKTLGEACRDAGLPIDGVRKALSAALATDASTGKERDWELAPLADLTAHIRDTHHQFTRSEIFRLEKLLQKLVSAHGKNHPELIKIQMTFAAMAQELAMHLMKEEMILFPYIERMEEAVAEQSPVLPAPFGTVRNPVAMMVAEHDAAGEALRELRAASNGYAAPAEACASYRALYDALEVLEKDLHRHIHLENNILFPERWRWSRPRETEMTPAAVAPSARKKLMKRAPRDRSQGLRRGFQMAFFLLNLWVGVEFYGFVRYCETGGRWGFADRPAGVEGWLPIASLMNLKAMLLTGEIPAVHAAGMFLLIAFVAMSWAFRKAFCS